MTTAPTVQFEIDGSTVLIRQPRPIQKLYIEVTAGCDLACPMCFRSTFHGDLEPMSDQTLDALIAQLPRLPTLKQVVIAGIGEPFTHPRTVELARACKERGAEVTIQSNGLLLSIAMLERLAAARVDILVVSHDETAVGHPNPDTIFRVAKRLKELRERGVRVPKLAMETVLTEENVRQVADQAARALRAGVWKIVLTNMLPTEPRFVPQTLALRATDAILTDFLRTVGHHMQYRVPKFQLNTERHCDFVANAAAVVRFDGEVTPCYRFLHSGQEAGPLVRQQILHHSFGNVNESPLDRIWHSTAYESFRFRVQHWMFPSCPDCSLRDGCSFLNDTSADCWTNEPSCANCLWGRQIYLCP